VQGWPCQTSGARMAYGWAEQREPARNTASMLAQACFWPINAYSPSPKSPTFTVISLVSMPESNMLAGL
jgi:hypothetical protein